MKNIFILSLVLAVFLSCSDTVSGGSEANVETVRIGLKNRDYRYVEVIYNDKQIGTYYTGGTEYIDTHWIDVPDADTITLIPVDSDCKYYRIHPVQDSVYRLN